VTDRHRGGLHRTVEASSVAPELLLEQVRYDLAPALLSRVAATWDAQDPALRQHAQAVARALVR
jgi:hypothetical protein